MVVPAGGIANVTVTVQLSEEDKVWMDEHFENGIYVEGFVYLTNEAEDGVDLSLPYLGFYGDWTDAPVFDSGFWYDNGFFGLQSANGLPDANEYYNVVWTSLGQNDWVLGLNPDVDPPWARTARSFTIPPTTPCRPTATAFSMTSTKSICR